MNLDKYNYKLVKQYLRNRFGNALGGFEIEVERENLDFRVTCSCNGFVRDVDAIDVSNLKEEDFVDGVIERVKESFVLYAVDEIRNGRMEIADFQQEYHLSITQTILDIAIENAVDAFQPMKKAFTDAVVTLILFHETWTEQLNIAVEEMDLSAWWEEFSERKVDVDR